jgi:hypothetical protein
VARLLGNLESERDALAAELLALREQKPVAPWISGRHAECVAFYREQIGRAKVKTPYGEGLPAPWSFLEEACRLIEALAYAAPVPAQDDAGDAELYRILKGKIDYSRCGDQLMWATLEWCVGPVGDAPPTLDAAILAAKGGQRE